MLNLLKTDLKRIFKDKLFLIVCLIGVGLSIFTTGLFAGMEGLIEETLENEIFVFSFDSKSLTFNAFSPLNDFGLILPIFIAIIIYKDFSYGTIRNKIISGNSRMNIYLSILLSTIITISICILGYSLLTFGFSSIFFDYSQVISFGEDFLYFISSLFFAVLCYTFIAVLISFACIIFNNVGIAIVAYFGVAFICTILFSIIGVGINALSSEAGNEVVVSILETINYLNVFNLLGSVIGKGTVYELKEVLFIILSVIFYNSLIISLGIVLFNKKDLK